MRLLRQRLIILPKQPSASVFEPAGAYIEEMGIRNTRKKISVENQQELMAWVKSESIYLKTIKKILESTRNTESKSGNKQLKTLITC
jgi:Mor family transcriptional regulator